MLGYMKTGSPRALDRKPVLDEVNKYLVNTSVMVQTAMGVLLVKRS